MFWKNDLRFTLVLRNSANEFHSVNSFHVFLNFLSLFRDNFLVLDIFFEALNYETIEQKKAYDVAGLLGELSICLSTFCISRKVHLAFHSH